MAEPPTPRSPDAVVTLREVTQETLMPVLRLKVKPGQEQFVADNATSIAEAHFEPTAWFRAIYADETGRSWLVLRYVRSVTRRNASA